MDTTPPSLTNSVLLPRPTLRLSYDSDVDLLSALTLGEVLDGPLDDESEVLAKRLDPDTGEVEDAIRLYRRGPDGPLIGFAVAAAFEVDLAELDELEVWSQPRFDVPTLALRGASIGEILLAARHALVGSTPDVCYFDDAVTLGTRERWSEAEDY